MSNIEDLNSADIDQIIEGIELFIICNDPDVDEIWRPYINRLLRLKAKIGAF